MTYPQPPSQDQPPSKRKWDAGKITLLVAGIVVLLCMGGGVLAAVIGSSAEPSGSRIAKAVDATKPAAPLEPTAGHTPAPGDFKLTPKITKKQCFGSAGCSVDYKVDVTYSGPSLDPDDTWVITYEATGDESGPITNQIELTGTQYAGTEESISTTSSGTKVKIKVTGVEKQ